VVGTPHAEKRGQSAEATSDVGAVRVDRADGRLQRLPDDYRQQSLLVSSVCVVQYIQKSPVGRFGPVDGRILYF
jgi:hypothetical protein